MSDRPDVIPPTPSAQDYHAEDARPWIPDAKDPFALLETWLKEAGETEPNDASAAALATVDSDGLPDVRIVLVRGLSATEGLTFYTNYQSAKGQQLSETPKAALCFHWKSQRRQVRLRGLVEKAADSVSDAYFNQRAAESRIAAIASRQSRPLANRDAFEAEMKQVADSYANPADIPRPSHWGGYHMSPIEIEFWQDQKFRTHDRLSFVLRDGNWDTARLYP